MEKTLIYRKARKGVAEQYGVNIPKKFIEEMKYSFTQLEKEFNRLVIELTDEKLVELNLLSSDGEITYEGILLSDQCKSGIKLIDYMNDEKIEVVTSSLIAQYMVIKEKLIQISTEMKYPLKSILEALKNMILHRDYS